MDIKGAFLNGKIEEEIYMRQPPGYETDKSKVCRLRRSLYGLKQAGREWNKRFRSFLINIGFQRATKEHCVYLQKCANKSQIIGVWVDDLFLLTHTQEDMEKLKAEIHREFEATDQGQPKYMLGIEIDVDMKSNSIRLSKEQYIQKIIDRFDLGQERLSDIPMAPNAKFSATTEYEVTVDVTRYRSAIG